MDFFLSHDWLNRDLKSYAFQLDHILAIVILMSLGILLAFLLRGKERKTVKKVMIILWIVSLVIEVFYYTTEYILCALYPDLMPFKLEKMLPLHSCSMFMYIFPLAIFVKKDSIKIAARNFLVVVNMIMGFITLFVGCPPQGYSFLSLMGFQEIVYHVIIVIVPLIMVLTNYYDLKKKDIINGLTLFLILSVTMWIFDAFANCDYFFIYDGSTFGILYEISENVPHIVWTLIVMTCYILTAIIVHYGIILIKHWAEIIKKDKPYKHKKKTNNT